MQYPFLKGVHFTYEILAMRGCKAGIQNEKGQTRTKMRTYTVETDLFYFTKCTLLNCACIGKGRGGKERQAIEDTIQSLIHARALLV